VSTREYPAITTAPVAHRPRVTPIWAYFDTPAQVRDLLPGLAAAGVPRDLIDVVVSEVGAQTLYGGRQLALRPMWRFASIGGMLGLLGGALVTVVLIAGPGFADAGPLAYALLLTPMITVGLGVLGGVVAALIRKPRPSDWRAQISPPPGPKEIMVIVRARGDEQIAYTLDVLKQSGGRSPRVLR
jgi:hypothetical protein